jgi:hypothetical protein
MDLPEPPPRIRKQVLACVSIRFNSLNSLANIGVL